MNQDLLDIPRRLNDRPKLFLWDADVALLFCMLVGLGMFGGSVMLGIAGGLGAAILYTKLRSGKHAGFALHALYWHLPAYLSPLRRTPYSHLREMIG